MWTPKRLASNYLGSLLVVVIAAFVRLVNLSSPNGLIFDEKFYQREANGLLVAGYELLWPAEGQPRVLYPDQPAFSIHPPFGKWVIAFFMQMFGPANPLGFRIGPAIFGIVAVVAVLVACALMTHSLLWANLAGLLLAIDGLSVSMSRVAMLDEIMVGLLTVGFLFVVLHMRRRSQGHETRLLYSWLIPAGFIFGLATATKWSALPFALFFLGVAIIYECGWLLADGKKQARKGGGLRSLTLIAQVGLSGALAYVWSWAGWFGGNYAWGRHLADDPSRRLGGVFSALPLDWQSFILHHIEMLSSGVEVSSAQSQLSPAIQWPMMLSPTLMAYERLPAGSPECSWLGECVFTASTMSNPVVWYPALLSVVALIWMVLRFRSTWTTLVLSGVIAGYLPWLLIQRDQYFFYAASMVPFLIMSLVLVVRKVAETPSKTRISKLTSAGLKIYLVVAIFAGLFFLPMAMYVGMPGWFWDAHIWLPGWGNEHFTLAVQ
jgi:dolichyl-phosphate-mannose-protein mannosyltransferase